MKKTILSILLILSTFTLFAAKSVSFQDVLDHFEKLKNESNKIYLTNKKPMLSYSGYKGLTSSRLDISQKIEDLEKDNERLKAENIKLKEIIKKLKNRGKK